MVFSYNTTPSKVTGYSPSFMLHGYQPRDLADHLYPIHREELKVMQEHIADTVVALDRVHEVASKNVKIAREAMMRQQHKKAAFHKFKVGDKVLLYIPQTPRGLTSRLCLKWVGPFILTEAVGDRTFKLKNLAGKLANRLAHVDRMKL